MLIFDTETTVDETQQLRVGGYQVREHGQLRHAGVFYDPESLTAEERAVSGRFAEERKLALLTRDQFIESVFFRYLHDLGGTCVGFNLPFDISRIAIDHATVVGSDTNPKRMTALRGGFTFRLSDSSRWHKVHVQVRHLNAREALIRFSGSPGQMTPRSRRKKNERVPTVRGHFVDAHTLGAALTSENHTLRSLADLLETEHRKTSPDEYGGAITTEFLDYMLNDVQVTWECHRTLAEMYAHLRLNQTPIHQVYSEASIGKGVLREIGVRPWTRQQADFPPEIIGLILGSYYGGRSEVRARREVRRVLYCDFLAMYPTVCTLMGLWRYVKAIGVDWTTGEDVTAETQRFLDDVTLEELQDPATWMRLTTVVLLRPQDDILPVRAKYDEPLPRRRGESDDDQYTIGLNHLTSHYLLSYTLADCIASKLLRGKAPHIDRAYQFRPRRSQPRLSPVQLAGRSEYRVDPRTDDLYQRMVELRSAVRREGKAATTRGDTAVARRLDADQLALKIMANATSYGIFIELNVESRPYPAGITWYGPAGDAGHEVQLRDIEEPGRFFHPLLAALITGAARLMLAIAERLVREQSIGWVLCDTDSMALARPAGMNDVEFLRRAQAVRGWFHTLSPYTGRPELFQIEDENFAVGDEVHESLGTPLYAFAISAKRYALFNLESDSRPVLRRISGHGLGHLRPPYDDQQAPVGIPPPKVKVGVPRWQHDVWYRIVGSALGDRPQTVSLAELPGFDQPAVTRYSATTPALLRWFKRYNAGKPYRRQVRPFGFMYAFQALSRVRMEQAAGDPAQSRQSRVDVPRVVAPYHENPRQAVQRCFDREKLQPVDQRRLKTYWQSLAQYHLHPEIKFRNGDYLDHGGTLRRRVLADQVEFIGKEANRWEEQFFLGVESEAQASYGSTVDIALLMNDVRAAADRHTLSALAQAAGVSLGTLRAIVGGDRQPHVSTLVRIARAGALVDEHASAVARETLELIDQVREAIRHESLRAFALRCGVSSSHLSEVLKGQRRLGAAMADAIRNALDA